MQPTSNKEYQWRPGNREELSQKLKDAKKKKGVTYEELAKRLKVTKTWLACAIDGQQWVPDEMAKKIAAELGVPGKDVAFLTDHPWKGYSDPILYRLHEVFDTFGPAIKEIIHEKFGNCIMSAIDFSIDVDKREDPNGDRIIITYNGKALKYSAEGKYPW